MAEWQDIETAPKDGTWFVALPKPELGFCGDPYPPTVARVRGLRSAWREDDPTDYDVDCKAMNCGSTWQLTDFTHWQALAPEPSS